MTCQLSLHVLFVILQKTKISGMLPEAKAGPGSEWNIQTSFVMIYFYIR